MTTANIALTKVVPTATTLTPYYDDFDESKNFHRFLFRPGYAVQARELTSLQTMIQNQIERFGNHIFKNGSLVLGGQISLDPSAVHINLQADYQGTTVNASGFTANTITYASGNAKVRAYVFGARETYNTEPPMLVVKYFTGDVFSNVATTIKSSSNVYANTALTDATGPATLVSINDGIFYINGYFVKVPSQTIIVDKYSASANAKIGLEYSDDIINESDDASLLDPAQEASNYQAPGATRLQINFDLVARSLDTTDEEKFVEILRVENGIIRKQIEIPVYSVIGDTMARRTYDESGNYTVKRFKLAVNEHPTDNTKVQLVLDPGKAYLKGYEYESIAKESLDLDKARTTSNVNNRGTTISIGNYVYVQNLSNTFDTSTMEMVDIHSVVNGAINLSSTSTYNATKIGTARVKQVKYYSTPTPTNSNTDIFAISLFDTRFGNLTSNVVTSSPNGLSLFDVTNKFSLVDDAYNGSTIRITGGTGSGEAYTIVNYVGATKTLNIAENWFNAPTTTSNISLDFDFDSANSIIKSTTYTSGATWNASANIHSLSKTVDGFSYFTDTTRGLLVYPVSDAFIKPGSITDQNFEYIKHTTAATFDASGSTTITLDSGETFYSTNDTTGIASTTLAGIAAFRINNGKRITLANISIDGTGQTAIIKIPNEGGTVPYKAYIRVNETGASEVVQKSKTRREANTSHLLALGTTLTQNSASGTTTVYVKTDADDTGQAVIVNPSNLPLEKMSLFMSDVKEILNIYDLNGAALPATGTALSSYTDVTTKYIFDTGQRDSFYDHASIALKPRAGSVKGPLIVCFKWYEHSAGSSDGKGYYSVDSYVAPETYAGIPTYIASTGQVIPLRDALDFRPTRENKVSTTPNFTLQEIRVPTGDTTFSMDYEYYLPRKALVALTSDNSMTFKIIDGESSRNPIEPRVDENSMILYKLTLDPYTMYKNNVQVQYVENKRYTMRDIGRLETRIENLEYYQALSILEKSADSLKILDVNGLERTKYGILADDFLTHSYGDVVNSDYFVAVDISEGGMGPASNVQTLGMSVSSNTNTIQSGAMITLEYSESAFVTQNLATKWVNIQPYMLAQWVGQIVMNPPDDNWIETTIAPDIIINNGQNDAIAASGTPASPPQNTNVQNNPLGRNNNWWSRHFGTPRRRRR